MFGLIFEIPGGVQEQYDKAMVELNLDANPAKGIVSHCAGPTPNGFRVVDVWESEADFNHFFETRLGRAIQNAGIPQPQITTWTVTNARRA